MSLVFYFSFSLFIVLLLFFFTYFLRLSTIFSDYEKGSPFECGFNCFRGTGLSFSIPFFVISLIFLLFDVEIILVCFYPFFGGRSFIVFIFSYYVIFSILFSTLYEWSKGILSWV